MKFNDNNLIHLYFCLFLANIENNELSVLFLSLRFGKRRSLAFLMITGGLFCLVYKIYNHLGEYGTVILCDSSK